MRPTVTYNISAWTLDTVPSPLRFHPSASFRRAFSRTPSDQLRVRHCLTTLPPHIIFTKGGSLRNTKPLGVCLHLLRGRQVPNQLSGDSKRQANDSIRGYHYQMWKSVHAWLDLKEDEILFIEGAEDFDIVGNAEATTVQVKNTKANITLRSQSVVDAIAHYWKLRKTNPHP